tara:strand:+ start:539 stop:718 length:180 start_codon:yes stop_codon:yes gene_type:complete
MLVCVDLEDLRVALRRDRCRVNMQLFEESTERLLLLQGDLLMGHQGVVYFLKHLVAKWF